MDEEYVARVKTRLANSDGTRADQIAALAGITREQLDAVGGVRDEVTVTVQRHGEAPARVILTQDEERMIADMAHLAYITDVLRIFAAADSFGSLMWRVHDGRVRFAALCSDTFAWGTADAEYIDQEDVPLLQGVFDDLEKHGTLALCELAEMYAARKRGSRPMNRYMRDVARSHVPAVITLYEECGPERESTFLAP